MVLRAVWLFLALAAAGCVRYSGRPPARDAVPPVPPVPLPAHRQIPDCAPTLSQGTACRILGAPSRSEAERELAGRAAAAWGSGDRWSIAYRAESDSVSAVDVGGGVQLPLSPLGGSRIWALALHLPGADSAVISLDFHVRQGNRRWTDTSALQVWRGRAAAPAPRTPEMLAGTLRHDSLWSEGLGSWRRITAYRPPGPPTEGGIPVVYFADGQAVASYAAVVDPLVASGALPPVALVGVWSSHGTRGGEPPRSPADDLRVVEYHAEAATLPGVDSEFVSGRYRAHHAFFTDDARLWAERELGVRSDPRGRALHGSSSGAHFVLALARESPQLYGAVIANSNVPPSGPPPGGWDRSVPHFLAAGVLEPVLAPRLTAVRDSLRAHGVPVALRIYPSGHDALVWRESLPAALAWWMDMMP